MTHIARQLRLVTFGLIVILAAAGLGTPATSAADIRVEVLDNAFEPPQFFLPVGDSVTWHNVGNQRHTATSSEWTSGTLRPGAEFTRTFTTPGTYNYVCAFHSNMRGTITVVVPAPPVQMSTVPATVASAPPAAAAASGTAGGTAEVAGVRVELPAAPQPSAALLSRAVFQDSMRELWDEHVLWTRLFIISFAADLPDMQPNADRLLQNQVDIGNAFKPFYGDAAGDRLTALLTEHILGAVDVLAAAKAGDDAALMDAQARWYANADTIADFLSSANPSNWPAFQVRATMREHLDLTTQEAVARLTGDWAADIAAYEHVQHHILGMADVLSAGVMNQFPAAFAPTTL